MSLLRNKFSIKRFKVRPLIFVRFVHYFKSTCWIRLHVLRKIVNYFISSFIHLMKVDVNSSECCIKIYDNILIPYFLINKICLFIVREIVVKLFENYIHIAYLLCTYNTNKPITVKVNGSFHELNWLLSSFFTYFIVLNKL